MKTSTLLFYHNIIRELDNELDLNDSLMYSKLAFEEELGQYIKESLFNSRLISIEIFHSLSNFKLNFDTRASQFENKLYELLKNFNTDTTHIWY